MDTGVDLLRRHDAERGHVYQHSNQSQMDASDGTKLTDYRAICLFNESRLSNGSAPEIAMLADTIFSVSMLVFGLIIRTVRMSRGVFRWTSHYRSLMRSKLAVIVKGEDFGLRRVLGHHLYTLFIARPLAVSWILGRLYLELCSSFLAEVCSNYPLRPTPRRL